MRVSFSIILFAAAGSVLAACASPAPEPDATSIFRASTSVESATRGGGALSRPPAPTNSDNEFATPAERLVYEQRTGDALPIGSERGRIYATPTLQLNFVNVDVKEAVRFVVNEAFGEPVAVAEGVSGQITLTSPNPVPTADAIRSLEAVLSASGLTLVDNQPGFLLTRTDVARSGAQSARPTEVGFGTRIVRVRNAKPSDLVRLVQPFSAEGVTVTPNDDEGFIILKGEAVDISEMAQTISAFDTPYLTGRVVGLFDLQFIVASDLQSELTTLLSATMGSAVNVVELVPLPRLNQILVITRTEKQFTEVREWINQLDKPATTDDRRLYYYLIQNAPAAQLGQLLEAAVSGLRTAPLPALENGAVTQPRANVGRTQPVSGSSDRPSITADELNNALLIRATASEYIEILSLIEKMDVMPAQVLIEATIAEVTLTDDLQYGVRWFLESGEFDLRFSNAGGGAVGPVFPGFSTTFFEGNGDAGAAINALASVTDVSVLSAPSIVVQNNQTADLQVGDQVPIVTQQAQSVAGDDTPIVSTVELRDTGVILRVKPRINTSGVVVLEIEQEVSDVAPTVTSGIDSPTIQQRQFGSTIALKDGQTAILGGLIRESVTDNDSGIPGLRRLPVMGAAFSNRSLNKRRTELIVFLTPTIIDDLDERASLTSSQRSDLRNVLNYLQSRG